MPDDSRIDQPIAEITVPAATDTPETRIGAGTALSLTAQILGLGTSFLVGVLVARMFGVEGKGALSVIMQVPGILIIVLDLGITTSMIYFVSRRMLLPGTAVANAIVIAAALGALGAPIIYLLLAGPIAIVPGIPASAAWIAMTILPLGLFAAWTSGVSTGMGNLVLPLRYAVASSFATLAGLGILVATGHGTLTTVAAVSALGTFIGVLVFVFGLRRHLRPFRPDARAGRSMARFSAKAYSIGVTGLLHERQDVLLLGWLAGAAAVGQYSVSVSFAVLIWYVPSALSAAIVAKGSRRSDESSIDYTTRTARIAVIFMTCTILVSIVVVPPLIPILYGAAFAPAVFPFLAILPGIFADGVSRILSGYQLTRGRLYWYLALGTMVLNLVAVVTLVPFFGAVGAALASTISYSALAILVLRRFCADTGANVSNVLLPQRSDLHVIFRTARQLLARSRADV